MKSSPHVLRTNLKLRVAYWVDRRSLYTEVLTAMICARINIMQVFVYPHAR